MPSFTRPSCSQRRWSTLQKSEKSRQLMLFQSAKESESVSNREGIDEAGRNCRWLRSDDNSPTHCEGPPVSCLRPRADDSAQGQKGQFDWVAMGKKEGRRARLKGVEAKDIGDYHCMLQQRRGIWKHEHHMEFGSKARVGLSLPAPAVSCFSSHTHAR